MASHFYVCDKHHPDFSSILTYPNGYVIEKMLNVALSWERYFSLPKHRCLWVLYKAPNLCTLLTYLSVTLILMHFVTGSISRNVSFTDSNPRLTTGNFYMRLFFFLPQVEISKKPDAEIFIPSSFKGNFDKHYTHSSECAQVLRSSKRLQISLFYLYRFYLYLHVENVLKSTSLWVSVSCALLSKHDTTFRVRFQFIPEFTQTHAPDLLLEWH